MDFWRCFRHFPLQKVTKDRPPSPSQLKSLTSTSSFPGSSKRASCRLSLPSGLHRRPEMAQETSQKSSNKSLKFRTSSQIIADLTPARLLVHFISHFHWLLSFIAAVAKRLLLSCPMLCLLQGQLIDVASWTKHDRTKTWLLIWPWVKRKPLEIAGFVHVSFYP